MPEPLVSICIPTRNNQQWLREAINSALEQTHGACEVIVIDDGSTDGTREILEFYCHAITWRSTPPRGGNAARNTALALARGEWVQFLDADDYLLREKVEIQLREGGNSGADLLLSPEWLEKWEDGRPGERIERPAPLGSNLIEQWFLWEWPGTQGCLWRKQSLERIGGWDESMPCCQDYELYARALRQKLKVCVVPMSLSVYRIWSEGTVSRRDPSQLISVKTRLIDEMMVHLKETGRWKPAYARAAGRTCFEMSRTLARFDLDRAAEYARERINHGLYEIEGDAAPFSYRAICRILGFKGAERVAKLMRRTG